VDLKPVVIEDIKTLAEKCNVNKVILFGSRARGTNHSRSDIDLAIEGGDTTEFKLSADEEIWTLLFIDVVVLNDNTSQELLDEIKRDGVVLYEKVR
jgi:predicted nucleotidyltransferase